MSASLGFAGLENVLYVLGSGSSGIFVAFLRAIMSVPLHCTTGIVIGTGLGLRKFGEGAKAVQPWWRVLRFPVFIHGAFNFCLTSGVHWASFAGGSLAITLLFGFMAFCVFFLSFVYSLAVWAREDFIAVPCCFEWCLTCPLQGTLCPWTDKTREQVNQLQIDRSMRNSGVPFGAQQQGVQMQSGVSQVAPEMARIVVPENAQPGQTIEIMISGRRMCIVLPAGAQPGQTLDIQV
jgi:hypothetical protein